MPFVGIVLFAAQAAAGAPGAADTARRECLSVEASSPQQSTDRKPVPSFSATQVLDIEFHTLLQHRPEGPRTLELKLYTPRGHLYQVLTVAFAGTASQASPSRQRWVDGFPRPLDEQVARAVSFEGARRYRVDASLPVAGTTIMINSLYGQWKVEPYLDGAPSPCGPSRTFEITQ